MVGMLYIHFLKYMKIRYHYDQELKKYVEWNLHLWSTKWKIVWKSRYGGEFIKYNIKSCLGFPITISPLPKGYWCISNDVPESAPSCRQLYDILAFLLQAMEYFGKEIGQYNVCWWLTRSSVRKILITWHYHILVFLGSKIQQCYPKIKESHRIWYAKQIHVSYKQPSIQRVNYVIHVHFNNQIND